MKKSLGLVCILAMVALPANAESIKKVVLYQDMAYITLEKAAQDHAVIIEAPPDIVLDSILATAKPGGTLTSLEIEPWRASSGKAKQLQELLNQKKRQLESNKRLQATYEKEIEIIYAAAQASRRDNTFPRQRLVESLAFIDDRVNALNAKSVRIDQEITELSTQVKDLEEQLQKLSQRQGYRLTARAEGVISISYAVKNAFWRPEYTLAALPGKNMLRLDTAARLWQSTGMDWEAEEILISTGRPSYGIQAPDSRPWYIAVPRPVRRKIMAEAAMMAAPLEADEAPAPESEVKTTATSFFIGAAKSVTLPGDGTPRTVRLSSQGIAPSFSRIAIPKLNQAVFLRAEGIWAGPSPIVPGNYTSFVDGEFCGKGAFKAFQPGEKLSADLGRDEGLKAGRRENRFHEKTLTGKDKTTFSVAITLENTRPQAAVLTVKDQLPLSQDEKVTVELISAEPKAQPDKDGILTWEVTCPANAKTTVTFGYTVVGIAPDSIW